MIGTPFSYFSLLKSTLCETKVLELLEVHGVKLDQHDEMFNLLTRAGVKVETSTGVVRFLAPQWRTFLTRPQRASFSEHGPKSNNSPAPSGRHFLFANQHGSARMDRAGDQPLSQGDEGGSRRLGEADQSAERY